MLHYVLDSIHNLGHAGLVVGAQKCGAVGGNQRLSLVAQQFREISRIEFESGHALQLYRRTVVVLDYLGLDILAAGVGSRVDMGDETNLRHFPVDVGRDACHHVAELIQSGLDAHCEQLVAEHLKEHQFLCLGRLG